MFIAVSTNIRVSDFDPLLVGLNITLAVQSPPAAIARPALQVLDALTIEKFVPTLKEVEVNVTVGFPAEFESVRLMVLLCPTLVELKLSEVGDMVSIPAGVGVGAPLTALAKASMSTLPHPVTSS